MVYSHAQFYSRKYIYLYTLILFITIIFAQIIQFNPKCRSVEGSLSFGYQKAGEGVPITLVRSWSGAQSTLHLSPFFLQRNKNIDKSIQNSYFVLFIRNIGLIFSRDLSLENFNEKATFLNVIYNSINRQIFITQTSRLIEQLKCNITSINTSKYRILSQDASDLTILDVFSGYQAEMNEKLHQRFDQYLDSDQSALASGTLIGAQSSISSEFKSNLISAGLIHVVVASGYNLTVVTSVVQSLCKKFFSKKIAVMLSLLSVWWYVFLALCNSAILRAGWMASISLLATLCGRPKSIWRVLTFSVLFLIAWDVTLITNISFQLSVFSTIGVLAVNSQADVTGVGKGDQLIMNPVEQPIVSFRSSYPRLYKILEIFKESFQTTLGANLFTLPITLFWFGRISVIALVANTLLLWVIPFIMYASSVFLVTSQISSVLAVIAALPIKWLSNFFLWGVGLFARLPFASFDVPKINFVQLGVSYAILFVGFRYFKRLRIFLSRRFFIGK